MQTIGSGHAPKKLVEVTSETPAKLFGLYPRKGAIQAGPDAAAR